jgi:hypothetical protein
MTFPANTLENALVGARNGDMSAEALLAALAENPLWVPLPSGADDQGNVQLPVVMLDGRPYVVAYTSAEQYAVGAGVQTHMELPGRELASGMPAELGLAVNPGAEYGVPVHPEGVRALRGGRETVPAGVHVRLGDPDPEPEELLAALRTTLAQVPSVVEARRALAQFGEDPPALLIGIRPDRDAAGWEQAGIEAVTAATKLVPPPCSVGTVYLDDSADPVIRWMLEKTTPFYTRAG